MNYSTAVAMHSQIVCRLDGQGNEQVRRKGWNAAIGFLAENGAELEPKDHDGKTPLDFANGNYKPALGGGVSKPRSRQIECQIEPAAKVG
jgi:hypothetical protein